MYSLKNKSQPIIIFMLLISSLILGCNSTENSADKAQNSRDALSAQNFSQKSKKEGVQVKEIKSYDSAPQMTIDTNKELYYAKIELEKGGTITLELYSSKVPVTVNNFIFLAKDGYYDGVTFHRVIPGFMAQTGDPTGTGTGSPGYRFDNEFHPDLSHDSKGIVSMANAGIQNGQGTNGSQFFITFVPTEFLDGYNPDGSEKDCRFDSCHSVFGKVIDGLDVLDSISERDPGTAMTPGDVIKTIKIEENN
tara:strand:- start:698 stop:1447 length:750 start_codon:yes stop_codon:yes gene_type:complete